MIVAFTTEVSGEPGAGHGDRGRDARMGHAWRATYESARARAQRGVSAADVLALGLPADYDLDAALRVAQTGVTELALLKLP